MLDLNQCLTISLAPPDTPLDSLSPNRKAKGHISILFVPYKWVCLPPIFVSNGKNMRSMFNTYKPQTTLSNHAKSWDVFELTSLRR